MTFLRVVKYVPAKQTMDRQRMTAWHKIIVDVLRDNHQMLTDERLHLSSHSSHLAHITPTGYRLEISGTYGTREPHNTTHQRQAWNSPIRSLQCLLSLALPLSLP